MKNWFIELLVVTLLGFLGIYLYSLANPLSTHMHSAYFFLVILSVFTFFIFSLLHLFRHLVNDANMAGIMLGAMFGRLVVVIASFLWYKWAFQPQGIGYVISLMIFYVIFLVYENYKLIQISNELDR